MTSPAMADLAAGDASPLAEDPAQRPDRDVPRHVAVIMDGNRRWAREQGVPEAQGHAAGVEAVRPIVERALQRSVQVLTIYAFSRENWSRARDEVRTIFSLLDAAIRDYTPDLVRQGVAVRLLGRLDEIDPRTRSSIEEALRLTAGGTRMTLNSLQYLGSGGDRGAGAWLPPRWRTPEDVSERPRGASVHRRHATWTCSSGRVVTQRISTSCCGGCLAEAVLCERYWPDFDPPELDLARDE